MDGIEPANWNWKVVHRFVSERFGVSLSRSGCLNYPRLHRGRLWWTQQFGEKASYYSVVRLETGEVEWMELEGNSNAGTAEPFLRQLREKHPGPLQVIWDNAPAIVAGRCGNICGCHVWTCGW